MCLDLDHIQKSILGFLAEMKIISKNGVYKDFKLIMRDVDGEIMTFFHKSEVNPPNCYCDSVHYSTC